MEIDNSLPLEKLLLHLEKQISERETEVCLMLDLQKRLLLKKEGNRHSIVFSDEELAMMEDGIFTHNHPEGSALSLQDMKFAAKNNLFQMRAVAKKTVYILSRPEGGWQFYRLMALLDKHKPSLEKDKEQIKRELYQAFKEGKLQKHEAGLRYVKLLNDLMLNFIVSKLQLPFKQEEL